jgi:maltooligosyltrehalose trehalohydrolase
VHGRAPQNLPGWKFVVAAQNHDQIGNRAKGDRLVHLTSPERLKIAAALVLTSPFVPLLFQGEEWGASSPFLYFTAHEDEELGAKVREGRRREFAAFGWEPASIPDPQSPETFDRSRLRWDELADHRHARLLEWYRSLIALRRAQASLRDGDYRAMRVAVDEHEQSIMIERSDVLVICNLAAEARVIRTKPTARLLLASEEAITVRDSEVALPAESVVILEISTS